jgi:hypothetical protein
VPRTVKADAGMIQDLKRQTRDSATRDNLLRSKRVILARIVAFLVVGCGLVIF